MKMLPNGEVFMFTRKNRLIWLWLALIIITSCEAKDNYIAKESDLDGTWVDVKEYRSSPKIKDRQYSWGVGKRIVETTLEIELKKKEVLIPGTGAFIIQNINKDSSTSILLDVKGPGAEGGWEMKLVFHFLDKDTFWLECSDLEGMFSVGKKKPWYRLSGPNQ
jgi:hypothetical protein